MSDVVTKKNARKSSGGFLLPRTTLELLSGIWMYLIAILLRVPLFKFARNSSSVIRHSDCNKSSNWVLIARPSEQSETFR